MRTTSAPGSVMSYAAAPAPCDSVVEQTVKSLVPGAKTAGTEIPSTAPDLRRLISVNRDWADRQGGIVAFLREVDETLRIVEQYLSRGRQVKLLSRPDEQLHAELRLHASHGLLHRASCPVAVVPLRG